jgi:hypothetical protein
MLIEKWPFVGKKNHQNSSHISKIIKDSAAGYWILRARHKVSGDSLQVPKVIKVSANLQTVI